MYSLITALAMAAPPGGAGGKGGNPIGAFLPLILIFVIFYFMLIRPQQKKQKEHQNMLTQIKKGDKIITSGGIYGTVANIKDNIVTIKASEGVRLDINKGNIATVLRDKAGE